MANSTNSRRVAILGGNRIPFARSDGAYANASNQDMFTAALGGLIDRFDLAGEKLGAVIGGAVLKHSRDFNLMRECVLGSSLSSYTPAFDIQQACGTGLQATIAAADGIAAGRYDVAAAGGVDTASDAPIAFGDDLRRVLLGLRRSKSNVDRLKLVGKLPASLGVEIPVNSEPRTGLSMGEHAAITAKQMGIKRVDQDELAAASHRNMAAAYDRGFFDDLVTPFLGLYRDNNLRADSSAEKLAKLKPVFGVKAGDATMTAGNSTPLTDGASVSLLASEEWAEAHGAPAGLLRRRRDGRGGLRERQGRPADGADVCGAATAGAKWPEPAGLRLLRDPRGVRVGGAGAPAGVGVRGVLQGTARPGRRTRFDRPVQAERQRLVAGGGPPVRRDRRPDRRAAGQAARREEEGDRQAGARTDLDLRGRRAGRRRHSRGLTSQFDRACNASADGSRYTG